MTADTIIKWLFLLRFLNKSWRIYQTNLPTIKWNLICKVLEEMREICFNIWQYDTYYMHNNFFCCFYYGKKKKLLDIFRWYYIIENFITFIFCVRCGMVDFISLTFRSYITSFWHRSVKNKILKKAFISRRIYWYSYEHLQIRR